MNKPLPMPADPTTTCFVFDLNGVVLRMRYRAIFKHLWVCQHRWSLVKLAFNPHFLFRASTCLYKKVVVEQHLKSLAAQFPDFNRVLPTALLMVNEQYPVPAMLDLLRNVRQQGHALAAFSNIGPDSVAILRIKHPQIFELFERVVHAEPVDQYAAKPSDVAFEKFCAAIKRPPHTLVLIDNESENIRAAARYAILGIRFSSPLQLERELVQLGLLQPLAKNHHLGRTE